MAANGRTPIRREAVRSALIAAGSAGITADGFRCADFLKAGVVSLRKLGVPVYSKRDGRITRYWLSKEIAGDTPVTSRAARFERVKRNRRSRIDSILAIVDAAPGGITRAALKVRVVLNATTNEQISQAVKAGLLFRCATNENGNNTIYFSTGERMAAYQALAVTKPPKVKGKPGRPKGAAKVCKPRAPMPLKLAPSKPKPPPIVREVIVPKGLKPIALNGFKPRDLAEGADLYFRQELGVGHYMPSSSAIARAYSAQPRA